MAGFLLNFSSAAAVETKAESASHWPVWKFIDCTLYIYQHFLFDFPFDEIYRRLNFFTLGRMYQIRI